MFRPLAIAAAAALMAACGQAPADALPAAPVAAGNEIFTTAPAAPAAAPAGNAGKVLQTQNGGGYTYAEVATASGQKVWIAGSAIDVKPGAQVEWGNFVVMRNFEAKSLGRSFPEILFVDRWGPAGKAVVATAPHGSFPQPQAGGAAPGGSSEGGVVKSITQSGGYSYIEVDRGNGNLVWVAAMETAMKAGDKVQWQGGTEMSNFTARSLGRTFDKIIFAQGVSVSQ